MATGSLPGDNLPTTRTQEDIAPVVADVEQDWDAYDENGNPING